MPQFLMFEPADDVLNILGDVVGLVDIGILLLDQNMGVRLINHRYTEMFGLPPEPLMVRPTFRDVLDLAAANSSYSVPPDELPDYLDQHEAAVRAGSISPHLISLQSGRRLRFSCVACPDGGRILTYTDISQELRQEAHDAAERLNVELRFSSETLEEQAAYLASLAETTDESNRKIEASRLELEREIAERCQLEARLRELATTDGLTGVLNRSGFMVAAARAMELAAKPDKLLAMLMLDVDHFKAINDRYGHAGGDLALQHLVATLRAGTRQNDLLGRLGGEEFAVVLSAASPELAEQVAERLRSRVAETPLAYGDRLIEMTISVGLAIQQQTDRTLERLIARADTALYQAKRGGRNQVVKDQQEAAA
jgi:diguanylate cyclase (GGDEF)-like protein